MRTLQLHMLQNIEGGEGNIAPAYSECRRLLLGPQLDVPSPGAFEKRIPIVMMLHFPHSVCLYVNEEDHPASYNTFPF